ncbi:unknown [Clostridium sp. CAG:354]|jgi:hypothetical protein|nr:hypothetical protein [Clostridium sp.]MEE0269772.1 hypothetical protein [Clostridia bacterium]OKZ60822.1 MAG: hypothetical protein BHV96_01210 [Clostridium sp. CAG:354_28_25]CDE11182.1 unknown [Clostridium sp. CAG:354]
MNNLYAKAYTEVLEIINHFSEDEYKKIPKEKIDFYEKHKDRKYDFKINPNIDLAEQNISRKANAILVSLFRDYFATAKQKEILKNLLQQNQEKLEKEKYLKYNPDNIFNKSNSNINDSKDKVALVEIKNEVWYRKILNFFKRIFLKH